MKRNLFIREYKVQKEVSELDFELYDLLFPKWSENDEEHPEPIDKVGKFYWTGESAPMQIDEVIKVLNQFKQKGCNHVEIMYHTDHIGYVFSGVDIHVASEEEIKAYDESCKNEIEEERKNKIALLEKQLKSLKGEK